MHTHLRFLSAFAAGLCLPAPAQAAWPDPIATHVLPYETSGLTHGPLLGAITASSVRVWVRTAQPGAFRIHYGTALPLTTDSAAVAGETHSARDHTGVVERQGLQAHTRYFYAVRVGELPEFSDLRLDYQWVAHDEPTMTVRFHDSYTGRLVYAETISTMDAR